MPSKIAFAAPAGKSAGICAAASTIAGSVRATTPAIAACTSSSVRPARRPCAIQWRGWIASPYARRAVLGTLKSRSMLAPTGEQDCCVTPDERDALSKYKPKTVSAKNKR